MSHGDSTDISALSMILPGMKYGTGTVRIELNICEGTVFAVKSTAIYTTCKANTIFQFIRIHLCQTFFCFIVNRAGFFIHFFQTEYFRFLTGRCGTSRTCSVNILITQFKWINSHLFCQYVNTYFRSHKGLRRTVSTESRTPCMIGTYSLALVSDIADIIPGTGELRET